MNRYLVIRNLGSGSCGSVDLVKEISSGNQYAIKSIHLGEAESTTNHQAAQEREVVVFTASLSRPFCFPRLTIPILLSYIHRLLKIMFSILSWNT